MHLIVDYDLADVIYPFHKGFRTISAYYLLFSFFHFFHFFQGLNNLRRFLMLF